MSRLPRLTGSGSGFNQLSSGRVSGIRSDRNTELSAIDETTAPAPEEAESEESTEIISDIDSELTRSTTESLRSMRSLALKASDPETTIDQLSMIQGQIDELKDRISTTNATSEALGISDFDVTGKFDINDIDDALEMVTGKRTGTSENYMLDYTMNFNANAAYDLLPADNLDELDSETNVSDREKQRLMQQYSTMMPKKAGTQTSQQSIDISDTDWLVF